MTENIGKAIDRTQANRSIVLTVYKDAPQCRLPPVGFANDRASNTEIIGFQGSTELITITSGRLRQRPNPI